MFEFEATLMEWTNYYLVVNLNFTDPLAISSNYIKDQLAGQVVNPLLFKGEQGQLPLSKLQRRISPFDMPRQLPHGFSEEEIKEFGKQIMNVMVIVSIPMAICIKSAIKKMW